MADFWSYPLGLLDELGENRSRPLSCKIKSKNLRNTPSDASHRSIMEQRNIAPNASTTCDFLGIELDESLTQRNAERPAREIVRATIPDIQNWNVRRPDLSAALRQADMYDLGKGKGATWSQGKESIDEGKGKSYAGKPKGAIALGKDGVSEGKGDMTLKRLEITRYPPSTPRSKNRGFLRN